MDERMQALLDYTIFHIGVYLTMGGAIVAANVIWHKHAQHLTAVLILLLVAGAAGGTVASNIPTAPYGIRIENFLLRKPTIFFGFAVLLNHGTLTQIEHGAFWGAIGWLGWLCYLHSTGLSRFGNPESIKSRTEKLLELVIAHPFLEDTTYISSWRLSKHDEKSIRYQNYCCFVFNLICDLWEQCQGDTDKMHKALAYEELLYSHHKWWTENADNKTSYSDPLFRDFVEREIQGAFTRRYPKGIHSSCT